MPSRGNRTGFTTGACSAAAARAATLGLVCGRVPSQVECLLPNGNTVVFEVTEASSTSSIAHAVVVKDAGDDPDATHGAHMTADVRLLPQRIGEIVLKGGVGVGTVTREGLGLEVGLAAINPVPRRNICDNVRKVAESLLAVSGLEVTLSVPDGVERAKKTLNARLGVVDGISILGTTGIVRPYSTAAFRASVIQAVNVAAAAIAPQAGKPSAIVFTTGGRTEKFAMCQLPALPETAFVQMGDFVKAAFTQAIHHKISHIHVGAMVGKLTKMSQNLAVTHAWKAPVDRNILVDAARTVGAPDDLIEEIRASETARFAAERLSALGLSVAFHRTLAEKAIHSLKTRYPGQYQLTLMVCDFEGRPIVTVEGDDLV